MLLLVAEVDSSRFLLAVHAVVVIQQHEGAVAILRLVVAVIAAVAVGKMVAVAVQQLEHVELVLAVELLRHIVA